MRRRLCAGAWAAQQQQRQRHARALGGWAGSGRPRGGAAAAPWPTSALVMGAAALASAAATVAAATAVMTEESASPASSSSPPATTLMNVGRKPTQTKTLRSTKKPHVCSVQNQFVPGCPELKVFAGNANPELAREVAAGLGAKVGHASVGRFADGEVSVKIHESVRGKDVYIVQPTSPPVNEHLVELLLMVSALRHASAKRVTVVVPYFGYMRSLTSSAPSKSKSDWNFARSNLAAADVARMMEVVGAQRVVAVDIYPPGQGMAEGFFETTPIETLHSHDARVIAELAEALALEGRITGDNELVVVSPHASCLTKAKLFKDELVNVLGHSIGLATIIRTPAPVEKGTRNGNGNRNGGNRNGDNGNGGNGGNGGSGGNGEGGGARRGKSRTDLVGNVKGKSVLIVEDIIETGRTTVDAVRAVRAAGAKHVSVYASHALLSDGAAERLAASDFEHLVTLNTVPVPPGTRLDKHKRISVAPMLVELIGKMHFEEK